VGWVGGRRRALKIAAGRSLALAHRPWAEGRVLAQARQGPSSDLLERSLTEAGQAWLAPHLQDDYPWELDGYVLQGVSIRRRVLSDWLAVRVDEESRMAAAHGLRLAYPLLDERLIGTLLHQDPLRFGEGQQRGRLIHRRAFAPFLPPRLQTHAAKGRVPEEGLETCRQRFMEQRRQVLVHHLKGAGSWHPALRRWWDPAIHPHPSTAQGDPAAAAPGPATPLRCMSCTQAPEAGGGSMVYTRSCSGPRSSRSFPPPPPQRGARLPLEGHGGLAEDQVAPAGEPLQVGHGQWRGLAHHHGRQRAGIAGHDEQRSGLDG